MNVQFILYIKEECKLCSVLCVSSYSGVMDENVEEIHWCLHTSRMEKIARVAAKKLFQALNPLDFHALTKEQYRQAIEDISASKHERKLLEKAIKFKTENEVSEDVFVEKIVKRLRGSGSLTSDPQSSVEMEVYENATLYQKVRRHFGCDLCLTSKHCCFCIQCNFKMIVTQYVR